MARRRVGMTMAAVAATIGAVLASAAPAAAATGSSVSAGAVNLTSHTAGSPASYTLQFTVVSALPKGGTITVQAPKQTNFLSCSSSCGSTYSILVSGGSGDAATVGSAAVSALTGSTTDNQLVLTLATSSIQAGDTVTVTTHNTSNTTIAGSSYSLTEFTSADTTPAQSATYSIKPGPAAAIKVAGGDNQSAQVNTSFGSPLVAEVDDAYGNPVSGATVAFSAPATGAGGTFNPADCTGGSSTTANTDCSASTGSDGQATVSIAANGTTGSYHVTASTSTVSGTKATSFTLTNTAQPPSSVTPGSVQISGGSQVGDAGVTYTAGFTATNAVPSGGTITLTFPDGTSLPAGSCTGGLLGCSGYSVTYNGGTGASVSAVATSRVAGPGDTSVSSTPNQVVLTLGSLPGGGIPTAGDTVSVVITGVTNPTLASSSYVADESTSSDPGVVATSSYSITAGAPVSLAATSGSAQSTQVGSPFSHPLVATAGDNYGNPVAGAEVTFVIGSSGGASAVFGNGTNTETDAAAANGEATTGQITANGTAGTYTVDARFSNGSGSASYTLTNTSGSPGPGPAPTPGVPDSVTITNGDYQSATVTTAFANLLAVKVTDAYGDPVAGASVTFTAPPSGPSGEFGTAGTTETVTTDSNGTATATQYLANTVAGAQQVSATDGGIGAIFDLTNTAGTPTGVKMVSGQNQSAAIDTAFAKPFVSEAVDRYGNPVPYASLLFGGPPSGPGGTFANGLTYEADTADAQGLATSSTFTANGVVGSYQLATGLSNSNYVLFEETNTYGGNTSPAGSGGGYWLAGADGLVQSYGDAGFYGSAFGAHLSKPVVGMAAAPGGNGYWLVASDGGVFNYGPGAAFHGSAGGIKLNQPIVGMAADPATGGYWLVAADGGVFSYDAPFYGSTGGIHLNKPIVGIAAAPGGNGYWLVASDGGIFAFGPGAGFYGSTGGIHLNKPVVGMAAAPGGNGYWLVASDGGIFSFGPGAPFHGSAPSRGAQVVGMAAD